MLKAADMDSLERLLASREPPAAKAMEQEGRGKNTGEVSSGESDFLHCQNFIRYMRYLRFLRP